MRKGYPMTRFAAIILLAAALTAANCSQSSPNSNSANSNAANSNSSKGADALPADAKPMGAEAPGFFRSGPTGNVSLHFASPQDGQTIEGNSIAPTFTINGYPIYKDSERNKGQHIHVILDNEPYEADYDPAKPFSPEDGKFNNLSPGTHTLRAFPSREWHESIKQSDAADFDMIVFNVGPKSSGVSIDKKAPLLTYSRPKGETRFKDDPRGLMLDFYVSNAVLGPNDYKVKYNINGKKVEILNHWEPKWFKWEELGAPGDYTIVLELLDKNSKPVPFKVG